jgi:hypothetical protein
MFTYALIALMMETVSTSEMLENFYRTTQHNIPEDSHLQKMHTLKNSSVTHSMIFSPMELFHS